MAVIKHPDTADKAGDYNLSHIDLINHKGEIFRNIFSFYYSTTSQVHHNVVI